MIKKIKTKLRGTCGGGILHDSRTDVKNIATVVNEMINKINELTDKVNELEKAQQANGIYP
jgi:hypothetical protein